VKWPRREQPGGLEHALPSGLVDLVRRWRPKLRETVVLLDRDGTIIHDSGYVGSVDRVQFIDNAIEAIEAIAALNRAGLPVVVVTNQAGVARGLCGVEDVELVHKHMAAELARRGAHVDMWLFCPYHPDGSV
jgi:D-sedoheptulose 7-phosphate isomerase/D-glycero-D-manno-heptose 1,7-bisphosphate phosphatase